MTLPNILANGQQPLFVIPAGPVGGAQTEATATEEAALSKILNVAVEHQRMDFWCWAAVASAVFNAYSDPAQQCSIATNVFSPIQCCPNNKQCDSASKLSTALGAHLDRMEFEQLDFEFVRQQIDAQKPVPAHIFVDGDVDHVVLILGYRRENGIEGVLVRDPAADDDSAAFWSIDEFRNSYKGFGRWDIAYVTKGDHKPGFMQQAGN